MDVLFTVVFIMGAVGFGALLASMYLLLLGLSKAFLDDSDKYLSAKAKQK